MVTKVSRLGQEIKRLLEKRNVSRDLAARSVPAIGPVMEGKAPPVGFENALFEFFVIVDVKEQQALSKLCHDQRETPIDSTRTTKPRDIDEVLDDLSSTPYMSTRGMLESMQDDEFDAVKNYAMAAACKNLPGAEDVEVPPVPKVLLGG